MRHIRIQLLTGAAVLALASSQAASPPICRAAGISAAARCLPHTSFRCSAGPASMSAATSVTAGAKATAISVSLASAPARSKATATGSSEACRLATTGRPDPGSSALKPTSRAAPPRPTSPAAPARLRSPLNRKIPGSAPCAVESVTPAIAGSATSPAAAFTAKRDLSGTVSAPGGGAFDSSETYWSWTVGGGVEYSLWDRWSTKVEYLYVGTPSESPVPPLTTGVGGDATTHIVRTGLNYRF